MNGGGSTMSSALHRIDHALDRLDLPVRSLLRPGVPNHEVEMDFSQIGLRPTGELKHLWSWHDGTDVVGRVLDDSYLFPGFYLLSHVDSIEHHRRFRADHRWSSGWVPVFANGGGDFFVVSLSAEPRPASEVMGFILGEEQHPVEFLSLVVMLEVIAECYERGAYFVSNEGYLEVDDQLEIAIAASLNPGVERWTSER